MTVAKAAKKLGVSASKVYQLVALRRIAHYRIDGKIVFATACVGGRGEEPGSGTAQRRVRGKERTRRDTQRHAR